MEIDVNLTKEQFDELLLATYRGEDEPKVIIINKTAGFIINWMHPFLGGNWRRIKRETRKAHKAFKSAYGS